MDYIAKTNKTKQTNIKKKFFKILIFEQKNAKIVKKKILVNRRENGQENFEMVILNVPNI